MDLGVQADVAFFAIKESLIWDERGVGLMVAE